MRAKRVGGALRGWGLALTVMAAVAAPRVQAQGSAERGDGAIDRAVAAWARIKTVRGTFDQTVTNPLLGSSASSRGHFVQERPNRMAIRFDDPASNGGAIVSDGTALWVYLPTSAPGQVIKRLATDRSAAPVDLGQFLDAPRARFDITATGTKTVEGHAAHGFTLVPKPGSPTAFSKASVWIDDDDSLIREFEATETSGVVRHIVLTSLTPNATVERDAFVFTVPKGVRVVDQTR